MSMTPDSQPEKKPDSFERLAHPSIIIAPENYLQRMIEGVTYSVFMEKLNLYDQKILDRLVDIQMRGLRQDGLLPPPALNGSVVADAPGLERLVNTDSSLLGDQAPVTTLRVGEFSLFLLGLGAEGTVAQLGFTGINGMTGWGRLSHLGQTAYRCFANLRQECDNMTPELGHAFSYLFEKLAFGLQTVNRELKSCGT